MTVNALTVALASGEPLDVREFALDESMSRLFDLSLTVVSQNADVDFEEAVGKPARFEVHRTSEVDGQTRFWAGVCARAELVGVDAEGLSTYELRIVPVMWLLTQRRNYRVFQDKSELDVVLEILAEWGITPTLELDAPSYGKRRMRVQYAESDFDFVSRLLEDIGVAYHFEQVEGDTRLVLVDAPNRRSARAPVHFMDAPNERVAIEYVTEVRTHREVRPGRYTQSDVDYRKALNYPLSASSSQGSTVEARLERYHHNYGSFLWKGQGGDTPVADDRGAARTNERDGARQVDRRLEAKRVDARVVTFRTIAHDLRPGKVLTILDHPRREIGAPMLVVASRWSGNAFGDWHHTCECRYTDVNYRPPLRTPKPRTNGVESATVTGPAGEEIHTDEFGRVRVHFHWDREGTTDETSSCWIPVSQAWAGAGFGAISLPRIGQEVLVDFLGADPDRPIVIGRVFTTTTPPPYELPRYKMVSGMRSETYPRPRAAAPQARMGGGPPEAAPPVDASTPTVAAAAATVATSLVASYAAPGPAGGGVPMEALGGGTTGAAPAGPAGAPTNQPGVFGGTQAQPPELQGAISRMRSLGPDARDQQRPANALVMDDHAGRERVYLQAQTDLFQLARRNFTGSIGANRAFSISGNDYEEIRGYQATKVGQDRTVEVNGKQTHTVLNDIIVDGHKNQIFRTKDNFFSQTVDGSQVYMAKTGIMLLVGTSSAIIMDPTAIVIHAPKVYINPGQDVMNGIFAGASIEQAVTNADREARIQAGLAAVYNYTATSRYPPDTVQGSIRATALGAPTPVVTTINRAGVTDPAEVREVARRAYDNQYSGLTTYRPIPPDATP